MMFLGWTLYAWADGRIEKNIYENEINRLEYTHELEEIAKSQIGQIKWN